MDGQTEGWKISPFYRTLCSIGAAALPQPIYDRCSAVRDRKDSSMLIINMSDTSGPYRISSLLVKNFDWMILLKYLKLIQMPEHGKHDC